jgi:hypothetical protein
MDWIVCVHMYMYVSGRARGGGARRGRNQPIPRETQRAHVREGLVGRHLAGGARGGVGDLVGRTPGDAAARDVILDVICLHICQG